jgi:hypothetical protein
MLPVWSDEYIVRRFLALQRVEWTHNQIEEKFNFEAKNRSLNRRKLTGDHSNQVWWSLASLIWNIQAAAASATPSASALEDLLAA